MMTNIVIMTLLMLFTAAIHQVEKQKFMRPCLSPGVPPPPPIVVPKVKVFAPPQPEVVKLAAQDHGAEVRRRRRRFPNR